MKKYTRKELIEICESAFVKEKDWTNRDSESAQCQLGECYALLKAGCKYKISYKDDICKTDSETIWIYIYSHGFMYFEEGIEEEHFYYLPTMKRLKERQGKDWY